MQEVVAPAARLLLEVTMSMSAKDYALVAGCISDMGKYALTHREKSLVCRIATMLSNRMRAHHHTFDAQKFFEACNLPKVEGFNC